MASCGLRCCSPAGGRRSAWPCETLLRTGCLTPDGVRFVGLLRAQGQRLMSATRCPDEAGQIAAEVALDHWLTWQIRHVATDAARVAEPGGRLPAG